MKITITLRSCAPANTQKLDYSRVFHFDVYGSDHSEGQPPIEFTCNNAHQTVESAVADAFEQVHAFARALPAEGSA